MCVVFCGFKLFPAGASSATVLPLPDHMPCSDDHHTAAGAKSSLYADSDSFPRSHQTKYHTDSFPRDETDSVINHDASSSNCSQLDVSAVSSCNVYGRDAFMNCEVVRHALDMGFDYETVRYVVHLKVVQSGRKCILVISDRKFSEIFDDINVCKNSSSL